MESFPPGSFLLCRTEKMGSHTLIRRKSRLLANHRAFQNAGRNRECCYWCRSSLVKRDTLRLRDFFGVYEVHVRHWECPSCGAYISDHRMWHAEHVACAAKCRKLLLERFPVESNEYLTAEKATELLRENLPDNPGIAASSAPVFGIVHNGRRIYLRKSIEQYLRERKDGERFPNGYFALEDGALSKEEYLKGIDEE